MTRSPRYATRLTISAKLSRASLMLRSSMCAPDSLYELYKFYERHEPSANCSFAQDLGPARTPIATDSAGTLCVMLGVFCASQHPSGALERTTRVQARGRLPRLTSLQDCASARSGK